MRPRLMGSALAACLLGACSSAPSDEENSRLSAYRLCRIIDGAKASKHECEVDVEGLVVGAFASLTPRQAQDACEAAASISAQRGLHFDRGWILRIDTPPEAGQSVLAACDLWTH